MGIGEDRLFLANRFAVFVEDGPATADQAQLLICGHDRLVIRADDDLALPIPLRNLALFGLYLFLDLAPEAVGIGEADLQLALFIWLQIADVRFARDGGRKRRLTQAHD